jgi:hypothetical protein
LREPVSYIVVAFLAGILGWWLKPVPAPVTRDTVSVHTDTVVQVITKPVVSWRKVADTLIYHDTTTIAQVDTIYQGDTTRITYDYASNLFTLLTRPAPDTAHTIYVTRVESVRREWWIDALTHIGAATLGYAVGSTR